MLRFATLLNLLMISLSLAWADIPDVSQDVKVPAGIRRAKYKGYNSAGKLVEIAEMEFDSKGFRTSYVGSWFVAGTSGVLMFDSVTGKMVAQLGDKTPSGVPPIRTSSKFKTININGKLKSIETESSEYVDGQKTGTVKNNIDLNTGLITGFKVFEGKSIRGDTQVISYDELQRPTLEQIYKKDKGANHLYRQLFYDYVPDGENVIVHLKVYVASEEAIDNLELVAQIESKKIYSGGKLVQEYIGGLDEKSAEVVYYDENGVRKRRQFGHSPDDQSLLMETNYTADLDTTVSLASGKSIETTRRYYSAKSGLLVKQVRTRDSSTPVMTMHVTYYRK